MVERALGIGFIGYGWMGRAHAHALRTLERIAPVGRDIRLVAIAGNNKEKVSAAGAALGFERATTAWPEVVNDPEVNVVANLASTDAHAPPCISALAAGKAVLCEKPLAGDPDSARAMRDAAASSSSPAVCGFNYRFVPAVRLAREVIASGRIGEIRHFRAAYLQDWAASPSVARSWRFTGTTRANGAVGDYSHIVDLCRYLAGEPTCAIARTQLFIAERPDPNDASRSLPVESEDWYAAALQLASGACATLEGSRCASGWKGRQVVEAYGSEGALWWDLEDLNRLHVFIAADESSGLGGWRDVLVTQPDHPFMELWWAPGHILGWEHTFVHQWREFLVSLVEGAELSSHQASFEDGYRAAVVCDAISAAASSGSAVDVQGVETAQGLGAVQGVETGSN
ncbi:Gfo/Idh/MocA family oxidoreductase [soil metagenome]